MLYDLKSICIYHCKGANMDRNAYKMLNCQSVNNKKSFKMGTNNNLMREQFKYH